MNINQKENTKIVATIGPASSDYEVLKGLVQAGTDMFRLNFSHGNHEDKLDIIKKVKKINSDYDVHIGIIADLQGPKLRIGELENGEFLVTPGDIITLTNEECIGTKEKIYMSYSNFAHDVEKGDTVLVDDGNLVFKVENTDGKSKVQLRTVYGGMLKSRKGVNLPDTKISLPCLTKKDLEDLDFILTQEVNWIALSFVREHTDVEELRERIERANHNAKIISKIEKPSAVENINKIIKASDGVMVARGDLAVEVPMEQLPMIQKNIINKCIQRSKPVIIATQMMESMITNPTPTRAEITDVANAVLDGTDAVMLSAETAAGQHPVKVIEAMTKIIGEAEKHYEWKGKRPKPYRKSDTFASDVVCFNASKTAEELNAKAIVGLTVSGYTAFKASSYRPDCKVFMFSKEESILATLNLVWGVKGFYYDKFTTTDETIFDVNKILAEKGYVKPGDIVVNTGTMPLYNRGRTNMMKVTKIE